MPITNLSEPPSRLDPSGFASKANALLGDLPTFVSEANALEVNVNAKEASAVASAASALESANSASVSASTAVAATNAAKWVSGTTYGIGDCRWSPITYYVYRRKTVGAGTTDPSADTTNWILLLPGVGFLVNVTSDIQAQLNTKAYAADVAAAQDQLNKSVPAGHISEWAGGDTPPTGWLVRDGSLINRTTYAALFSAIGTRYGAGDGTTTFALPDDRGVVLAGYKSGDAAFGSFGSVLGNKDATLVYHGHSVSDPGHTHSVYDPGHAHSETGGILNGNSGFIQQFAEGGGYIFGSKSTSAAGTGIGIYGAGTGISVAAAGSSATNANIQPTRVYLPIIKY
jgi:microcystin-dependent protein